MLDKRKNAVRVVRVRRLIYSTDLFYGTFPFFYFKIWNSSTFYFQANLDLCWKLEIAILLRLLKRSIVQLFFVNFRTVPFLFLGQIGSHQATYQ